MKLNKDELNMILSMVIQTEADMSSWCEKWLDDGNSFYDQNYRKTENHCRELNKLKIKLQQLLKSNGNEFELISDHWE